MVDFLRFHVFPLFIRTDCFLENLDTFPGRDKKTLSFRCLFSLLYPSVYGIHQKVSVPKSSPYTLTAVYCRHRL